MRLHDNERNISPSEAALHRETRDDALAGLAAVLRAAAAGSHSRAAQAVVEQVLDYLLR